MPDDVHNHGSEYDGKMAVVEALVPNDPAFGGFAEKVWMLSGSPMFVTEIIVDILQRWYNEREAGGPWRCSSRRNAIPHHIRVDEKRKAADRGFFFVMISD